MQTFFSARAACNAFAQLKADWIADIIEIGDPNHERGYRWHTFVPYEIKVPRLR